MKTFLLLMLLFAMSPVCDAQQSRPSMVSRVVYDTLHKSYRQQQDLHFNTQADSMMISDHADFAGSKWQSFQPVITNVECRVSSDGNAPIFFKLKTGESILTSSVHIPLKRTDPTNARLLINEGAAYCNDPEGKVRLAIYCENATEMLISNSLELKTLYWIPYTTSLEWQLSPGDGLKTVAIKFRNGASGIGDVALDHICLDRLPPRDCAIRINKDERTVPARSVIVDARAKDAEYMQISMSENFEDAEWIPYTPLNMSRVLKGGNKVEWIYARFSDKAGNVSEVVRTGIKLKPGSK